MSDYEDDEMKKQSGGEIGVERILLVDGHPVVREGIQRLVSGESSLELCVAGCSRGQEAIESIERENPSLLMTDIALDDIHGLALIKKVRAAYPDLPILVFSSYGERVYIERALRAGARGYVTKQQTTGQILEAIRTVLAGKLYVPDGMASTLLADLFGEGTGGVPGGVGQLSDREIEVLELIGAGEGTIEIADRLFISVKTVESHRANIKAKLNLKSASDLLSYAIHWTQAGP
jgi:DNA-binding NarL/FixJ family response regulator